MKKVFLSAIILIALTVATHSPAFAAGVSSSTPVVAVSILPQTEFVRRIGGDKVRVFALVGPGASPHSYEPTPRQMADLSSAGIWFTIGVEFEKALLPKVKSLYPKLVMVDTARGVRYRNLETHEHEGEASAEAPDSGEDGGPDPHIWLGYNAVKLQLATIRDALSSAMPRDAAFFKANHDAYLREIDAVYSRLRPVLAPLKGARVFVYHPSFGYFLDDFGILQEAVEVGGKEPTQKTLAALVKRAKEDGAKVIFVQKQFSTNAAKTVASAIGGVVQEIDPLAADWLANIQAIGAALARSPGR